MVIKKKLEEILFFDIETVRITENLEDLKNTNKPLYDVWEKKKDFFHRNYTSSDEQDSDEEVFNKWVGMSPEFGKIVCFSFGIFKGGEKKITSYSGEDEFEILKNVHKILISPAMRKYTLCAHNGKNFDLPFLSKRFIINGIMPPDILPNCDTKPWEMNVIDTKDVWSYGVWRTLSSLDLVCAAMGIQTPKDDIDGSQVGEVFYTEEGGVERIEKYCEKDVVALMEVVEKLVNLETSF